MSAIGKPQPVKIQPVPSPVQTAPAPPAGGGWAKWIAALVVLGVIAGGVFYWQRQKAAAQQSAAVVSIVPTVKVTTGDLETSIRLTGQTSSLLSVSMIAPKLTGPESGREMILLYMAKSGVRVKKGEVVAQIDAQSLKDHIEDVNDDVQQANSDIRKRQAEQAIDFENLNQTLRVAKANLDKARLERKGGETRTVIDQELLKLAEEEAEAAYNQQVHDVDQKKIIYAAELKILEYTRERHVRHRDRHASDVDRFTMRAPMDGLAVSQPIFRSGEWATIQQGDQVNPGQLFMKVVTPEKMQVEATINQAESEEFRIGQEARISIDAFPGLTLPGKIYSISAIAAGGWRQNNYIRTIPVRVTIAGYDPRLIPDLSGSVDVVLSKAQNVTKIPRSALQGDSGSNYVFVKNGPTWERRTVTVGVSNLTHVAVSTGLQPGEEVATERPRNI
ncbi:MAG TPA: HlyD family efflux transporter periplasmic adaptor subunit [Bryobacteraceae bacterium]|nr:HlyD family efflux transporter periplasmic adaptor subunit [Bryobacteraceae bacterium]